MPLYYDVIHVFGTPAELATKLKNGMIGYDTTNDRFAFRRLSDGVIKYFENDTDQSFVKTDGSTPITGDQTIQGELNIKTFSESTTPTLAADGNAAFFINTSDSNKVYLRYRRASGDEVGVQLT